MNENVFILQVRFLNPGSYITQQFRGFKQNQSIFKIKTMTNTERAALKMIVAGLRHFQNTGVHRKFTLKEFESALQNPNYEFKKSRE